MSLLFNKIIATSFPPSPADRVLFTFSQPRNEMARIYSCFIIDKNCKIILRRLIKESHRENIYNKTSLFAGISKAAPKGEPRSRDRDCPPLMRPAGGNGWVKANRVQCRRRRTETNITYQYLAHVSTAQSMINHLEFRIIMPLDGIQYLT